jgi:hypothetical protein
LLNIKNFIKIYLIVTENIYLFNNSPKDFEIAVGQQICIDTEVVLTPPEGTYGYLGIKNN